MLVDVMTKEIKFSDTKEAFVGVDNNAMGGELFENSPQILEMLFWSGTGDEDVINVGIS